MRASGTLPLLSVGAAVLCSTAGTLARELRCRRSGATEPVREACDQVVSTRRRRAARRADARPRLPRRAACTPSSARGAAERVRVRAALGATARRAFPHRDQTRARRVDQPGVHPVAGGQETVLGQNLAPGIAGEGSPSSSSRASDWISATSGATSRPSTARPSPAPRRSRGPAAAARPTTESSDLGSLAEAISASTAVDIVRVSRRRTRQCPSAGTPGRSACARRRNRRRGPARTESWPTARAAPATLRRRPLRTANRVLGIRHTDVHVERHRRLSPGEHAHRVVDAPVAARTPETSAALPDGHGCVSRPQRRQSHRAQLVPAAGFAARASSATTPPTSEWMPVVSSSTAACVSARCAATARGEPREDLARLRERATRAAPAA